MLVSNNRFLQWLWKSSKSILRINPNSCRERSEQLVDQGGQERLFLASNYFSSMSPTLSFSCKWKTCKHGIGWRDQRSYLWFPRGSVRRMFHRVSPLQAKWQNGHENRNYNHVWDSMSECRASGSILIVSPGAEWHSVLIRAPVTGIGHFEQIFVSLEGFFGRLDPIEDQVIIDDFLTARGQGWGMNNQYLCKKKKPTKVFTEPLCAPTVTLIFFFFSSSMYSICFLKASRSWFSIVLATRT